MSANSFRPKLILGIESSCDETASSVLLKQNNSINILSNIVASSSSIQSKYGGIIPEQAAREQIKSILPVIQEALSKTKVEPKDLDAIAVTNGPGLIGSLLVGVETAKTLSWVWDKPLIGVNHLIGHFYANWINYDNNPLPKFPCLGLLVSGGHSDLVLFTSHGQFEYLGGTRDDAAGECFDKCARMLGYPYPGGPKISKLAESGNPSAFKLPRPMSDSGDYDFSFSGLKTAFSNLLTEINPKSKQLNNLCASIEQAIIDSLIKKVILAVHNIKVEQIIIAGGVASNKKLREELIRKATEVNPKIQVLVPPPYLCTDNAAMIASAAFYHPKITSPFDLQANPNLSLDY